MNSNTKRKVGTITAAGTLVGISVLGLAAPATAATTDPAKNEKGDCLITPSRLDVTNHAEVSHLDKVVTPGEKAVMQEQQRWSRDVPMVDAVTHQETKLQRTELGDVEISYEHWKYSDFIKGLDELSYFAGQFSKLDPGQKEISSITGQFLRENPGQREISHQVYKYSKVVPPVVETKYKKEDVKTKYQYQKSVTGVIQKWNGYKWVNTGDTFGPEFYIHASTQWSFDNKDVLESGGHSSVQAEWSERGWNYRKLTTNYQYVKNGVTQPVPAGTYTYGWFTSNPGSPWVSTGVTQVKTPATTEYYNGGNWTTDVNPAGWTKIDEKKEVTQQYIAPFTEYRAQDGSATSDVNNAGWFPEESFPGWSPYGERKKDVTQEYIAPFTVYRAQDGSETTDPTKAGWFKEEAIEGWSPMGERKKFITQHATEDKTLYLTRDDEGNLGESTDEADAAWFKSSEGIDPKWDEFDREKFYVQEPTDDETFFLTQDDEGNLGESTDEADASWIDLEKTDVNLTIWQQMVDERGNPLERTVTDQAEVPGYTEYYVQDGEPTRELGDSNWTTDEPEDWTFVDKRDKTIKEATPDVVTFVKIVDKEAWSEKKAVPAKYGECELPFTGAGGDLWGAAGLGMMLLAGGGLLTAATLKRRAKHSAETISS